MAEPGPEPKMLQQSTPSTPADPVVPQGPQQLGQQIVYLNWSHFKIEFSGKPNEEAGAHLLCTNDWINAHHFVEGVKEPINVDWQGLQNLFEVNIPNK